MTHMSINYHGDIIPKKIEDIIQKNINIIRCIDNMTIEDIGSVPRVPGTYILQFIDRECYRFVCRFVYETT